MATPPNETDPAAADDELFAAVHALALRGRVAELPDAAEALLGVGLAHRADGGYELTALGYRCHRAMLERERRALDLEQLALACARMPALARRLSTLRRRWCEQGGELPRRRTIGELCGLIDETEPILRRAATVAPRFGAYLPRLHEAAAELRAGRREYALERAESIGAVWRELHEDCLQTLGRAHDLDEAAP